ncbi:hypothetical protein [Pendulispora albinea]|uniref:Uncharacterized protein n=1 Tax=Pendulispora albinea TaxID=2741071 RepID=A0ABZ2LQ27_9BACT
MADIVAQIDLRSFPELTSIPFSASIRKTDQQGKPIQVVTPGLPVLRFIDVVPTGSTIPNWNIFSLKTLPAGFRAGNAVDNPGGLGEQVARFHRGSVPVIRQLRLIEGGRAELLFSEGIVNDDVTAHLHVAAADGTACSLVPLPSPGQAYSTFAFDCPGSVWAEQQLRVHVEPGLRGASGVPLGVLRTKGCAASPVTRALSRELDFGSASSCSTGCKQRSFIEPPLPPTITVTQVSTPIMACSPGASVKLPLPQVFDSCSSTTLTGTVVSVDGAIVNIPVGADGSVVAPPGALVVRWTATGSSTGLIATAEHSLTVLTTPTLYATDALTIGEDAAIVAPNGRSGTIDNGAPENGDPTLVGPDATVGDIFSVPSVSMRPHSTVEGAITTRGEVLDLDTATVTGTVRVHTMPLLPMFPTVETPVRAGPDVIVSPWQQRDLAPGAYGQFRVAAAAQVTLHAGLYTFDEARAEGRMVLDQSRGPIRIVVKDDFVFAGTQRFTGGPSSLFVGAAQGDVRLPAAFLGSVVAPHGSIWLGATSPRTTHIGTFAGVTVNVAPGATVTHRAFECR